MLWIRRAIALLLALSLTLLAAFGPAAPARADIRITKEANGQLLYQTRQSLRDERDQPWQVVFFKRQPVDKPPSVHLRLVGFPDQVRFEHPQPLSMAVASETIAQAADVFSERSPAPNVGEYDLADIVGELPAVSFLQLQLPLTQPRVLRIPYFVVRQWQAVAQR